jgi:hypothetical protein
MNLAEIFESKIQFAEKFAREAPEEFYNDALGVGIREEVARLIADRLRIEIERSAYRLTVSAAERLRRQDAGDA